MRHGFSFFDSTVTQFQWLVGEAALMELTDGRGKLDSDCRETLLLTLILSAVGLHEGGQFSYIAKGVLQFLRSRMRADDMMLLGRFIAGEGDVKVKDKEG